MNKNLPTYNLDNLRTKSIFSLLDHEMNMIASADNVLKKLEKAIMHPDVLKTLSFEQMMRYADMKLRRQQDGRNFLIDFCRVTSKSTEIQSALKQHIIENPSLDKTDDGRIITEESESEIKRKLLLRLEDIVRNEQEEEIEIIEK